MKLYALYCTTTALETFPFVSDEFTIITTQFITYGTLMLIIIVHICIFWAMADYAINVKLIQVF